MPDGNCYLFLFFVVLCFNGLMILAVNYYIQTATEVENESDASEMRLRLSMLKHYQFPGDSPFDQNCLLKKENNIK